MVYRALFLCMALWMPLKCLAQQQAERDPLSLSYQWYIQGQWDSLYLNRNALYSAMQGQDSYYLRYRVGEAAWRKQEYRTASIDFAQAYQLNRGDTFSLRFLHQSLIASGQSAASLVTGLQLRKHGASAKSVLRPRQLHSIYTEGGLRHSNLEGSKNLQYLHGGVYLQLHPKWSLYSAITQLKQEFSYGNLNQQNTLLRLGWQHSTFWKTEFFAGNLNIRFSDLSGKSTYDAYAFGGIQWSRMLRNVDLEAGYTYHNFYLIGQHQEHFKCTFYPRRKRKQHQVYGQVYVKQAEQSWGYALRAGWRIPLSMRSGLLIDGYQGNIYNQIEDAGFLPNNASDLSVYRLRAIVDFPLGTLVSGFIICSQEGRTMYNSNQRYSMLSGFVGLRINGFR